MSPRQLAVREAPVERSSAGASCVRALDVTPKPTAGYQGRHVQPLTQEDGMRVRSGRVRGVLALAATALLSACGEEILLPDLRATPAVEVSTAVVSPGSAVSVRLMNDTFREWSYHLCAGAWLQRLENGVWVDAPRALVVCSLQLSSIGAGGQVDADFSIPLGIPLGTHRLIVVFDSGGNRVDIASNPFTVE